MPDLTIPLTRGERIDADTDYRDFLSVNMTAVDRSVFGAPGYMLQHPGLTQHATGIGIDRGGYWNERQAIHFRVSGEYLISVSAAGAVSTLGSISGSKKVSLTHSFNSQAVVADGKMWLYSGTLTEVTDPDLGNPIDITWIDGYYFLTDGEFLYHTDLTDESSIDPLRFATSEFSPDPTLAVDRTSDNQVIVFNRFTTEFFINRATDNFAFQRIQAKAVKCGIVGTHCETELEGVFYVLGGGREEATSVHFITAGLYRSIATREIDKIIATYTEAELEDAVLETRVEDRYRYIIVRLPNHTLLYNKNIAEKYGDESAWTIVKSSILDDGPWRGINGVNDPRVGWIYGDRISNKIGRLDNTVATQYGESVETVLYGPLINLESASIDELELDILPGHQINIDDVTTFLSLTYNGITFGKEQTILYGQQFDYNQRFIAYRLGYVRDYFGVKLRTVSPERLAFSSLRIAYG